jgi:hypothetical protein
VGRHISINSYPSFIEHLTQGSFVLHRTSEHFLSSDLHTHTCIDNFLTVQKWAIDAMAPDRKDIVVKAKQLEALKRLGHSGLELNEYERV